jgi:hypothetical protein
MAAGSIAAPGTQYGPCNVECGHSDCASVRRMAEAPCTWCGQPIGYDRSMYRSEPDTDHAAPGSILIDAGGREYVLVHSDCEERAVLL